MGKLVKALRQIHFKSTRDNYSECQVAMKTQVRVDSMIHRHLADFLSCDVPRRSRVEEEEAGDYLH